MATFCADSSAARRAGEVRLGLPKPDRRLLMFGKGPSIPGVPGTLPDPQLDVLATGEANDNWTQLAFPLQEKLTEANLAPTQLAESALWPTFVPGVYTVRLKGANGSAGIGLVELYEY